MVILVSPLDYETAARHTLVIRAADNDPSGGSARFTEFTLNVLVEDVNDNSPVFANHVNVINVPETLSVGKKQLNYSRNNPLTVAFLFFIYELLSCLALVPFG